MLRIYKLILSTTLFSFTLSNIEIKQVRVSWYDSGEQCNVAGLKTADITEIDNVVQDKNPCRKGEGQKPQYWIRNDYKFSNMISVEGCFINNDLHTSVGRQSLLGCYRKCLQSPNEISMFAFKNDTGNRNCKCNFNATDVTAQNLNILDCITFQKSWWKYRIHKNVVTTSKNPCRKISCTDINLNDHFRRDILCGSFLEDRMQDENLRYVCSDKKILSSTDKRMLSCTDMPRIFSFMSNAPIAEDLDQSETVFTKCNAISCLNDSTYEPIVTDCTSNMSGVICLNGTSFPMHSTNTPFKSSLSSINVHMSHQPVNSSPHTPARKMSTVSISMEKNAYASSVSKLVHVTSTPAYTPKQMTKFATEPEALVFKFPFTYISFDLNSQVTRSSKQNIIYSTSHEVLNQNVNDDSPIGLLVGLLVMGLVIIVITVLIVVCRFKNKGPLRHKRYGDDSQITKFHSPSCNEKDVTSNRTMHTVQNSTYDMHATSKNENEFSLSDPDSNNINNTPDVEYAVVIKNKQMIGNTTNQQQSHDEENLEVIENEYDGLNHNRPDSFDERNNINNIYDTALGVRVESDSTYVTASHVQVIDKDENCVYDHM